ncbi:hypothetical protein C8250_015265 [Streptomyces sp. So13.3]|uniref:hypothetical protein n=1 Tax=unclassified Streptomyces TaxID=2593676 RepID=UPI001106CF97|nr:MULTISPECIES: hypothetical protein [unclassified Streptomyces]NEA72612.1 hypothetical protein [Streptomyces sp. SID13588]QNA73096.1 hypothetical protein C8250_015265 [Streptomyces sp. So13.3]
MLYDGPFGGLGSTDVPGVVQLSCLTGLGLDWSVRPDAPPFFANHSEVMLELRRPEGDMPVRGVPRGIGGGWSNGAVFGSVDAPLKRIVAHWFNLPCWPGTINLTAPTEDGGQRSWSGGRWVHDVDGWKITLDVRPDHAQVWTDLHEAHVFVMTHVMELRRADGASFTAIEAEPVLTALHVGVSFALGRWAAPMLPVGQNGDGDAVWEEWRPSHCDPARNTSPGWWYERDPESLAILLDHVVKAFADPDRLAPLRLQMMFAITSTNDRGFVEQRVTMGAAGLEHIMWQTLVLGQQITKDQYSAWPAHKLLRKVLNAAQIPIGIDPSLLPVMAQFVAEEQPSQGQTVLDGAEAVTRIRNRLMHPKGAQESVYRLEGLLTEAWLLTRHYLVLLILHSVGYRGSYRDLRRTRGWVGDIEPVPWI